MPGSTCDPLLRGWHLDGVEALDVGGHALEAGAQVRRQPVACRAEPIGRDPQRRRPGRLGEAAAEACVRLAQGGVTAGPHVLHVGGHPRARPAWPSRHAR